jgi:Zn-dependent protease/CBS domain-containing protein
VAQVVEQYPTYDGTVVERTEVSAMTDCIPVLAPLADRLEEFLVQRFRREYAWVVRALTTLSSLLLVVSGVLFLAHEGGWSRARAVRPGGHRHRGRAVRPAGVVQFLLLARAVGRMAEEVRTARTMSSPPRRTSRRRPRRPRRSPRRRKTPARPGRTSPRRPKSAWVNPTMPARCPGQTGATTRRYIGSGLKAVPAERADMRRFHVGSAFGIPIRLDLTFLLVLPLFAWLIGAGVESIVPMLNRLPADGLDAGALVTSPTRWVLGLVAAVGLFVGVVLHELGHSLVARSFGYPIESITLWLFGGIAQLEELPEDWKEELAIALAGPVVSVALGAVVYLAFAAVPASQDAVRFVLGYLAMLNVALAAFNLLPAFPMDGGRVLRALLGLRYPYARATQLAAEVGKLFAILFGLAGLVGGNIVLIGVAFFVYIGAAGEAQQVTIRAAFEGVSVGDIMTPAGELHTVTSRDSVAELVERMFRERHTGYPVVEDGLPVGMVTLSDAEDVSPVEREAYTVADVMSEELVTVDAHAPVTDALELMREHGVGRLPVVDGGELVGLISRTDVMHALDVVKSAGQEVPERLSEAG